MRYRYAIIGAGRQGTAAAYELAMHGDASQIIMVDLDEKAAYSAAAKTNRLKGHKIAKALKLDVQNQGAIEKALKNIDAFISAVPYYFNLNLTRAAIKMKAHMTDMGGNEEVVAEQLKLNSQAQNAGITVVPDCGMGPGMTGILAAYGINQMDTAQDVFIWDGGLPQNPKPPWNFRLTFHINGLTNEYHGYATFLRQGRPVKLPCFTEYELVDFPPLGKLEAFVTSGGTSTAIQTYKGKLRTFQNKTLRYPGHYEQFRAYQLLGLYDLEPISVGENKIIPRDFFHTLLEPNIRAPKKYKDICLIRVLVRGLKDGHSRELRIELVDRYDKMTNFTAMERLTGWHTAIMLEMALRGKAKKGVVPLETAVNPEEFILEVKDRGFEISEHFSPLLSNKGKRESQDRE